jgi:hypothetical protein
LGRKACCEQAVAQEQGLVALKGHGKIQDGCGLADAGFLGGKRETAVLFYKFDR